MFCNMEEKKCETLPEREITDEILVGAVEKLKTGGKQSGRTNVPDDLRTAQSQQIGPTKEQALDDYNEAMAKIAKEEEAFFAEDDQRSSPFAISAQPTAHPPAKVSTLSPGKRSLADRIANLTEQVIIAERIKKEGGPGLGDIEILRDNLKRDIGILERAQIKGRENMGELVTERAGVYHWVNEKILQYHRERAKNYTSPAQLTARRHFEEKRIAAELEAALYSRTHFPGSEYAKESKELALASGARDETDPAIW
jgi:hypothetical protein